MVFLNLKHYLKFLEPFWLDVWFSKNTFVSTPNAPTKLILIKETEERDRINVKIWTCKIIMAYMDYLFLKLHPARSASFHSTRHTHNCITYTTIHCTLHHVTTPLMKMNDQTTVLPDSHPKKSRVEDAGVAQKARSFKTPNSVYKV